MPHVSEQQRPLLSDATSQSSEATLRIHRNGLKPDVRAYADNLRDQVRDIWKAHGVTTIDAFEDAARTREISLQEVREVNELLKRLHETVEKGEIPIEQERLGLRVWMQDVYNELGIKSEVPLPPELTKKQKEAFKKFGFRPFYIPAIAESEFQSFFVRPYWEEALDVSKIERWGLRGQWVAMETIPQPNNENTKAGPDGLLTSALHIQSRFDYSWFNLHRNPDLLTQVAEIIHQPTHNTRLPTVEEWNFLANLFHWLVRKREENLPEIGLANTWEWTENVYKKSGQGERCIIGNIAYHGIGGVRSEGSERHRPNIGFRVLVELDNAQTGITMP